MNQIRSTGSAVVLAVIALTVIQGCREATAPSYEAMVRTTQTVYELPAVSTSPQIGATLTNTLGEPILLDGIGRDLTRLEKWVSGSWRTAYTPEYIDIWVPPIELDVGQTRKLQIWLLNVSRAPNTFPIFEYEIPGTYRAVFVLGRQGRQGFEAYSNAFELRLAR